jgi:hypothetical protein
MGTGDNGENFYGGKLTLHVAYWKEIYSGACENERQGSKPVPNSEKQRLTVFSSLFFFLFGSVSFSSHLFSSSAV